MSERFGLTKDSPIDHLEPEARSRLGELLSSLLRSGKGMTGAIIIVVALSVALTAGIVAPYSPSTQSVASRFAPPEFIQPGSGHPLGADNLGRDLLSRMLHGSRVSISVAFVVTALAASVGSVLGGIAGFKGGLLETLIMRATDLRLAFPFMLVALVLMAILGTGLWTMVLTLSVALWVNYARLVRGEALQLREMEYVQAAHTMGISGTKIIFTHIIPNILPSILVLATLDAAAVIIFEASLSFLGLGIQPPTPSWGVMLSEGRNYLYDSPWMSLVPGMGITLTVVGINLFGDWLRDELDPSLKSQ